MTEEKKDRKITTSELQNIVCEEFCIEKERIMVKDRTSPITMCRHFNCYFLHKEHHGRPLTYREIAALTGNTNHATVISSIRVVNDMIKTDKRYAKLAVDITNRIDMVKAGNDAGYAQVDIEERRRIALIEAAHKSN